MDRNEANLVPPDRLMDAVDAIYVAVHEIVVELGKEAIVGLPSEWMGTEMQPRALCDFTAHEVEEAEAFLRRCGLIQDEATL